MKRFFAVLFGLVFLAAGRGSGTISRPQQTRLILATATTGGTYYPVGVAIATLVSKNLGKGAGITMTAISSAGSGENLQLLDNREADLAIIQGLYGAMAWQGRGRYQEKPQKYLRSISVLWDNFEHFVIQAKYAGSGDMSDMAKLHRKNFSIGRRGSGTEISGRIILEGLGFDPDKDFKLKFLGYTPSAQALQNGRIAGMNIPAGPPASAITQAYAALGNKNLRILEFSNSQMESVNKLYGVWRRAVLKAGTYPGQEKDLALISQPNLLVVHADVAEGVVYQIVRNLYENLAYLQQIHQATQSMDLEKAVDGLSLPLHPGALRYYDEMGLNIPTKLR
jgi:TRAP transporter TAXI family solute receptor